MASWHFHSHFSMLLQATLGVPQLHRAAFHLGCFAPDLVRPGTDKLSSHFTRRVLSLPLFWHRLTSFRRHCRVQAWQSADHLWFYRGYYVHLVMDRDWVWHCLYPFLLQDLRFLRGLKFPPTGQAYYQTMLDSDGHHRYLSGTHDYDVSLTLLADSTVRGLLPPYLEPQKVDGVISLLQRTRDSLVPEYRNQHIPWDNVRRFLRKSPDHCAECIAAIPSAELEERTGTRTVV